MNTASFISPHQDHSMIFLFSSALLTHHRSLPPSLIHPTVLSVCWAGMFPFLPFLSTSTLPPFHLLHNISSSQTALLGSLMLPPFLLPQAACCVGEGRLPFKMSGLAVLLPSSCSVAPSLPAWMGHHHLVGEGMQRVVHNLHFHWVVGRQVPQRSWEKQKNGMLNYEAYFHSCQTPLYLMTFNHT